MGRWIESSPLTFVLRGKSAVTRFRSTSTDSLKDFNGGLKHCTAR